MVVGRLNKRERAAIGAVARHFAATWKASEESSRASIAIGRKRISVDVATVKPRNAGSGELTRARLRRDKVVVRLVERLQMALRASAPDGITVILAITAPIRLASKTAAALEEKIRAAVARASARMQRKDTIRGNHVRFRLVKSRSRHASRVIALVHNPEADPERLSNLAQSLLQRLGAAADRRSPTRTARERWLVLLIEGEPSLGGLCRQVYTQLMVPTEFARILMVLPGGRVETLAG